MVEEAAQELIQDQTALDQAPQHLAIGFERSEVVSEARGDRFGRRISKAAVGKRRRASARAARGMSKVCSTQPRSAIERPVFGWTVKSALTLVVKVRHHQPNGFRLRFVNFSPRVDDGLSIAWR